MLKDTNIAVGSGWWFIQEDSSIHLLNNMGLVFKVVGLSCGTSGMTEKTYD